MRHSDEVERRQRARKLILRYAAKNKTAIEGLTFYGVSVKAMDRDELYGVIGWLTDQSNLASMVWNNRPSVSEQ